MRAGPRFNLYDDDISILTISPVDRRFPRILTPSMGIAPTQHGANQYRIRYPSQIFGGSGLNSKHRYPQINMKHVRNAPR